MIKINCKKCGTEIKEENISKETSFLRCTSCSTLMAVPRGPIDFKEKEIPEKPYNLELEEQGNKLRISGKSGTNVGGILFLPGLAFGGAGIFLLIQIGPWLLKVRDMCSLTFTLIVLGAAVLIPLLISYWFIYSALYNLFTYDIIDVSNEGIKIYKKPFPGVFSISKSIIIKTDEINQLYCEEEIKYIDRSHTYSHSHSHNHSNDIKVMEDFLSGKYKDRPPKGKPYGFYSLWALLKNGKKIKLYSDCRYVDNPNFFIFLERKIENFLHIRDRQIEGEFRG